MNKYHIIGAVLGLTVGLAIVTHLYYHKQLKSFCAKEDVGAEYCECVIETMRKSDSILNWKLYWQIIHKGQTEESHPEQMENGIKSSLLCIAK